MTASKWRDEDILYFWPPRRGGVEGPGRKCNITVFGEGLSKLHSRWESVWIRHRDGSWIDR